jgi:hypothetical protein
MGLTAHIDQALAALLGQLPYLIIRPPPHQNRRQSKKKSPIRWGNKQSLYKLTSQQYQIFLNLKIMHQRELL